MYIAMIIEPHDDIDLSKEEKVICPKCGGIAEQNKRNFDYYCYKCDNNVLAAEVTQLPISTTTLKEMLSREY